MKKYSRFATAALASSMVFSAMGMAVMAADTEQNDWTIKINKTITKDENTAWPNQNFSFNVRQAQVTEDNNELSDFTKDSEGNPVENNVRVYAEPVTKKINDVDVNAFTVGQFPATPVNSPQNMQPATSTKLEGNIQVNTTYFAGMPVGVYRFVAYEVIPEDSNKVEDLTYDTSTYYIDVFVTNTTVDNQNTTAATGLRVKKSDGSESYKETTNDGETTKSYKADGLQFLNDYTKTTNEHLHDLVVQKIIAGNQASMGQQFEFTVKVYGALGEQFHWATDDKIESQMEENVATVIAHPNESGTKPNYATITCKLGHNEKLTVYGLSENDTYEVVEANTTTTQKEVDGVSVPETKTNDGYTVTTNTDPYTPGNTVDKNLQYTVTNTKEGDIPTGILLTAAPYAAVVALGGAFAGLFFRRKRED